MQKALIFNNVSITFVKRNDNKIHFGNMGKDETINTMKLYVLKNKVDIIKLYKFFKHASRWIKQLLGLWY